MSYKYLIEERLRESTYHSELEEENALKEILQEFILYALSDLNFFKFAAFHGGTELRIVRNLKRFSEDLDFALIDKNRSLDFSNLTTKIKDLQEHWGIKMEIIDKSKAMNSIKKMLLKESSLAKLLIAHPMYDKRKIIRIKIELDINPPNGMLTEERFLEYPVTFPIKCFDISTGFAGKLHAILCRGFLKGRDWYDFVWYVERNSPVNMKFLTNALYQQGPWKKQNIDLSNIKLIDLLRKQMDITDWHEAAIDTAAFLNKDAVEGLKYWGDSYFLQKLSKFKDYLVMDK